MDNGLGKQGSRPGQTRQERLAKARSGAFAGRSYAQDNLVVGRGGGGEIRHAGQGTNVVKKTALDPSSNPKTKAGDPWARPDYAKPGAF